MGDVMSRYPYIFRQTRLSYEQEEEGGRGRVVLKVRDLVVGGNVSEVSLGLGTPGGVWILKGWWNFRLFSV